MDGSEGSRHPTIKEKISSAARCGNKQMQELEEYIRIQEDYFADQMSESILQETVVQEEHQQEREQLHATNADLTKFCAKIEVKYEHKWLALLVAEANLMSAQETTNTKISKLRRDLATT